MGVTGSTHGDEKCSEISIGTLEENEGKPRRIWRVNIK
jgi:hypothetical protein